VRLFRALCYAWLSFFGYRTLCVCFCMRALVCVCVCVYVYACVCVCVFRPAISVYYLLWTHINSISHVPTHLSLLLRPAVVLCGILCSWVRLLVCIIIIINNLCSWVLGSLVCIILCQPSTYTE
jgi:hypothetical protein